jgi:outer membrane protein OmpA-like peptidoglycan-associated protein
MTQKEIYMKTLQFLTLATSVALFAGCATVAPNELLSARSAYQHASDGPAKQLAPDELHKAHEALALAEQSFQKDSDSYKTKDLAYVAQRKSEQAGAIGAMAADKATKERANADFTKKQTEMVKQGKQELSDSEKRTADARAELDKQAALKAANDIAAADFQVQQAMIAQGKQELVDSEKLAAREKADAELLKQQAEIAQGKKELSDSEKRTADALAELAALATLKEETRGLVVTLSGGVLFQSAKSTLLPSAQVKLDQVAKALLAIPARNLIVEGHTDSQGSESYNQGLSQRRADVVHDYLVQRGYPADHVQSLGRGEANPIADNASPEGRANNRRVEIIIERELQTSKK